MTWCRHAVISKLGVNLTRHEAAFNVFLDSNWARNLDTARTRKPVQLRVGGRWGPSEDL